MTCWPAASPAAFDSTDIAQIQATATWVRDSNLFRLPENFVPPPGSGIDPARNAETTRTLGVGLKIEKLLGRQRLIADLSVSESVFEKNANLDFLGGGGRLAWMWQVGNDWSGEAGYSKRRTLGGFADFQENVQDLIDTDTYALTAGYQFHPRWRIAVELTDEKSVHSARPTFDVDSRSAGATISYRAPSNNSIGFQARRTDRDYPNRLVVGPGTLDNGHKETRLNAIVAWRFSGALKLDAQAGQVDVRHDNFPSRDFSGGVWRAAATWDATGKLRLSLNGSKDVRLYEDVATSYIVVSSVGLSPVYTVTAKLIVQGDFNAEKRDFRGDPGVAPIHEDDTRLARVSVRYSPIRNLELYIAYETGDRKSNVPQTGFEYQSWLGTIKASF